MADELTTDALRQALIGEFRAAVEAVDGSVLTTEGVAAPSGTGWSTPLVVSGGADGHLTLWIDDAGVTGIARAMMGLDEAPEPSVAADMLKELWAQATAAVVLKEEFEGLTLTPGVTTAGTLPAAGQAFAVTDGATVMATLSVVGDIKVTASAAPRPRATAAASSHAPSAGPRSDYPGNLAALLDIDLPLVVRFARTEMSLRSLAQLGPGSMVDMGRSPDAPVQLLIGSQVVAEGEVVVVSGNYGVRITSLVSPADRLRAMEL